MENLKYSKKRSFLEGKDEVHHGERKKIKVEYARNMIFSYSFSFMKIWKLYDGSSVDKVYFLTPYNIWN